ncbi:MAG: hypothetical protein HGB22_07415 [Chlorobiaceae bacterium]|nr:hypothetical protein [Chlorobiaceae bacterium]
MTKEVRTPVFLLYAVFAALVIGTRFMIVASYGNITPYWDQWDAIIDRLLRPWIDGTLQWQELIAPHNEHRVFTGRVLSLSLFLLNGRVLNPMLEIAVNALLYAGTLLLLLHILLKMIPEERTRMATVIFATLLFSVPLAVENILMNNSSLYFILLFSFLFLYAISRRGSGGGLWDLLVVVSGLLACLSFASGALTLAAGVGFLGLQWMLGVQRNRNTIIMILVLAVMTGVAVHFTPSIPGHAPYKSRSILDFAFALFKMTGGVVFYIPSLVFMFRQLQRKPKADDPTWFLFALCVWLFGQMSVIAYGRGNGQVLSSRYLDLYAVGILANLAAFLVNMRDPVLKWSIKPLSAWVMVLFIGIGIFLSSIARDLSETGARGVESESRVRTYLATHDESVLNEKNARIPYPDPKRLKSLLDQKAVQSLLPSDLVEADGSRAGKRHTTFARIIFFAGSILVGIASGLCCYLLFIQGDPHLLSARSITSTGNVTD